MDRLAWTARTFTFGLSKSMLAFYLERLEGTMPRIAEKVNGISDDILSFKPEGKWSVKQNIGHLAEVDEIALKRIEEMLTGTSPMTSAVFENKQDFNALPIDDVIHYFNTNRRKNLERYKSLQEHELEKSSMHPRLNVLMTPVDLAWFDAEHDDHHLARISEIIAMKN